MPKSLNVWSKLPPEASTSSSPSTILIRAPYASSSNKVATSSTDIPMTLAHSWPTSVPREISDAVLDMIVDIADPSIVIVKAFYPLLPGLSPHDRTSIRPRLRVHFHLRLRFV